MNSSAGTDNRRIALTAGGVLATAAATVIAWWAWLGHDTTYQTDPATGVVSGPYETGQVAGCVLTLIAIVFVAALYLRPRLVTLATTLSFTVAWSWSAATEDDSGLWLVGAIMIVFGLTIGCFLVSLAASLLRRRLHGPSAPVAQR